MISTHLQYLLLKHLLLTQGKLNGDLKLFYEELVYNYVYVVVAVFVATK